jgi:outer membrane autotransporter protein
MLFFSLVGILSLVGVSPVFATSICGPITINVTNTDEGASAGSLGAALAAVNANGNCGGAIDLSAVSGETIQLSSGFPTLSHGVTFMNNGMNGNTVLMGLGAIGAGTSVVVSGVLSVDSNNLSILGGAGAVNGGSGGTALLSVVGHMSVDPSAVTVAGGDGADNPSGNGGDGGDAAVTVGSLDLVGSGGVSSTYQVAGGDAGNSTGVTGNGGRGGDASFGTDGAVLLDDGQLSVMGGRGGSDGASGGIQGQGGDASVSIGSDLTMLDASNLIVTGGTGGTESGVGTGGACGSASLSVQGAVSMDSSNIYVMNNVGGSSVSGTGGNGGDAIVRMGATSLNVSSINVRAGNGGVGPADGTDGDASVDLDSAVLSGQSSINITSGFGGLSDLTVLGALTADQSGVTLQGGSVSVSLGSAVLTDSALQMGGTTGSTVLDVVGGVSVVSGYVSIGGGPGPFNHAGDGRDGGDASVSIGSQLTVEGNANLAVVGGNGGSSYYDLENTGVGGSGGKASLTTAGAVSVASSVVNVAGGVGGSGNGLDGTVEGKGGDASVTMGVLVMTSLANLNVRGGVGGEDDYGTGTNGPLSALDAVGGDGGSADLVVTGVVSVDNSAITLAGGGGGLSQNADGGKGGNVSVSFGSDATFTTHSNLDATAGVGGMGSLTGFSGVGSAGGSASLSVAGALRMDASRVNVAGGDANIGWGSAGTTAGAGGGSVANLGSLVMTDRSYLNVVGGFGKADLSYADGGAGGSVSLAVSGAVSIDDSTVDVVAGGGGNAGFFAAGGKGGDASLRMASAVLDHGSAINVIAGDGGLGPVEGFGGDASVSIGSLDLVDASSILAVQAGSAGSNLNVGSGSVYLGVLNGTGQVDMTVGSPSLQVASGDFSGSINGTTGLMKVGGRGVMLTLRGINTYSGATTVAGGVLSVDTYATLGVSDQVSVETSAILIFRNAASASGLTITNAGLIDFGDNTTAGTAVIENKDTIYFYGNSTTGACAIHSVSGAHIGFMGSVGGDASLIMDSGSLLDLYPSDCNVTLGAVNGGGDILLGGRSYAFGTLDTDMTLSGVISDSGAGGSLIKLGSGVLTLTGDNTYSGGTVLQDGGLVVGGLGALGLGDMTLKGGTLSCGSGIHAIEVQGNYDQNAPATLSLGLAGIHADGDVLWVAGRASLDGDLTLFSNGSTPAVGDAFVVMSAIGGVSGRYASVNDDIEDVRFYPVYLPSLVVMETLPISFAALSKTHNQTAVGDALDALYDVKDPAQAGLMAGLGALKAGDYPGAYEKISPSSLASLYEVRYRVAALQATALGGRMSDFLSERDGFSQRTASLSDVRFADTRTVTDDMATALDVVADSPATMDGRWGGFFGGDAGNLKVTSDGNGEGYKATFRGLTAAGADYRVRKNLAVGLLFGYQDSDVDADGGSHLTIKGGQVGVYGLLKSKDLYAQALIEGGKDSYDSKHASFGGVASGKTDGTLFTGQVGLGYRYVTGRWTMGPVGSLQYTRVKLDGFQETGSWAPEDYPDQAGDSLSSNLGVQAAGDFKLGRVWTLMPSLRGAWVKEFDDKGGSVVSSLDGEAFTVDGSRIGQSGFRLDISLGVDWKKTFDLSARYQKDLGRDHFDAKTFGGQLSFKL